MTTKAPISKQHISFKAVPTLKKLCQPLLNTIEVDYFYYLKYLDNQRIILLTLTPQCAHYLVEHKLLPLRQELKPGIYYLPSNATHKSRLQISEHFHLHHNLELIQNTPQGLEIFGFAVKNKDSGIINTYLNKLTEFNNFIAEFKKQAAALILEATHEPINLSPGKSTATKIFNHNQHMIKLNKRELEVLIALHEGLSAKETAKKLGLSPRTIEYYLANVKNKLGISKKTALAKFVSEHHIASS